MSAPRHASDYALEYARRGWNPVPVGFKTKKPIGSNWQTRVIREADVPKYFNGAPLNVGVVLGASSGGLTDVDIDCPEAGAIAPYVLPETGALFGRASSRDSHWLYISNLHEGTHGATIQFRDPLLKGDEAMLLELRIGGRNEAGEIKGAQTVMPGSVHESGEYIVWEENREPATVDGEELARSARLLAACSLLARYWPGEGARHDAALTLGGFLARCSLKPPEIKCLIEAITRAAGDDEWRDRIRAAEDAAIEYTKNRPARGFPALKEAFGDVLAKQVAEWLEYRGSASDYIGPAASGRAGPGSNSNNQLPRYAEVAEELLRRMNARDEDLQIVADEKGNEHTWLYRAGLWSLLLNAAAWLDHQIELTLRDMKLCEASSARFIYEARKYIERSPNVRTQDKIVWDDHGKIPTRAGLIDPVTLTIEPLKKENYATWCLDVEYDPAATCPLWLEMLSDFFAGQSATECEKRVTLLQEFMGTTLIDRKPKSLRRALVLLGASDTGKSSLLRVMSGLLTDKPISTPFSDISGPHGLQEFTRRAPWVLDEAFDIGVWHLSSRVKAIISGDPQSINPKGVAAITMRIKSPCLWGTNHPPTFKENTDAMVNRVLILKLTRVFRKGEFVGVAAKARATNPSWEPADLVLERERPGILNWALIGLQRVLKRGNFVNTDEGESALDEMRLNSNPVAGFINDCIDFSSDLMMSTVDFHAAFTGWRQEHHGDDKTNFSRSFVGKNLSALSHPLIGQDKDVFKENGVRYYMGVAFNDEGRAHFQAMATMQATKNEMQLQGMSASADKVGRYIPGKWRDHPEVVKLNKSPAPETGGTP